MTVLPRAPNNFGSKPRLGLIPTLDFGWIPLTPLQQGEAPCLVTAKWGQMSWFHGCLPPTPPRHAGVGGGGRGGSPSLGVWAPWFPTRPPLISPRLQWEQRCLLPETSQGHSPCYFWVVVNVQALHSASWDILPLGGEPRDCLEG